MATFYFNEVLPESSSVDICAVFENTMINTAKLISKLRMTRPIITSADYSKLCICGTFLKDIIAGCKNRDVRNMAYNIFAHNIIEDHESSLTADDVQLLVEAEYKFEGADAINLAIAHKKEWPLLSMPLSAALQRDKLELYSERANNIEIINYYGQGDTSYIVQWFAEKANVVAEGLERFKSVVGEEKILLTRDFEKGWNKAISVLQDIAYARFKFASDKGVLFPVRVDGNLIKRVGGQGTRCVYELRQLGQGVRIYFGYSDDGAKIIMAGFHTKAESEGEEQTADINRAARQICLILANRHK